MTLVIGVAQGSVAAATAPVPRKRRRERAKTTRTNGQADARRPVPASSPSVPARFFAGSAPSPPAAPTVKIRDANNPGRRTRFTLPRTILRLFLLLPPQIE